jgi:hypothetical protein
MIGTKSAALFMASVVCVLACATPVRAEVVQKGDLRISVNGKLSPHTLPRKGRAPVAVSVGGRISTVDGGSPPQLHRITIAINRNGVLDYEDMPTCDLREIQPSTSQNAMAACRDSFVGDGTFAADVKVPQQTPFPSRGKVLLFNGSLKGRPVLFAHVYGTEPVPTSYTLPFMIRNATGSYGTVLEATLPHTGADWGFVTGLELRVERRQFRAGGETHSFLSAGCPAPKGFPGAIFPLLRTSFAFVGRTVSTTINRSCGAR